jgi:subtilisin family serine protease
MQGFARRLSLAASILAASSALAAPGSATLGVNVLLDRSPSAAVLGDLGRFGRVRDVVDELNAVTMQTTADQLAAIRALPYVTAANPDAERKGAPVDTVAATDFTGGASTWDLDAVNVTDFRAGRTVAYDGTGVYVAVIDTGLVDSWRQYFPQERIATELGIAFAGGGGEVGTVSSQPNKWEHDQNSHGTHVTSTILGYSLSGTAINGVAPKATVIPVKVLNQNGSGWSSVVARGITYVADLKKSGQLDGPVVINMSLGGPSLDAMEKAAIDYAIANGVLVVAAAGNEGTAGMGYPGAYAPVISVAATGWVKQWTAASWWRTLDVADPTAASDFYIAGFSSRQLAGQQLDVAAPGSWIVGPYQVNSGQTSYYYLSGTSMASPHVAGVVALMAQKAPALGQAAAEAILAGTAIHMPAGCVDLQEPSGVVPTCWGSDATGAGLVTADAALAALP